MKVDGDGWMDGVSKNIKSRIIFYMPKTIMKVEGENIYPKER